MENSEILESIKAGNKEVIKAVYMENMKDVYNFAKEITGDHDSAIEATKKAFTTLFNNIKNGDQPANIRTAALKLAYDEACSMVLPSSDTIDSPFDKSSDAVANVKPEKADEGAPARAEEAKPAKPLSQTQVFNITDVSTEGEVTLADDDEDEPFDDDEDEYEYEEKKARRGVRTFIIIINIILVVILLWLLFGLLCNFSIIPESLRYDLGYSWVNSHIYTIF